MSQIHDIIRSRRSISEFTDMPVSREIIDRIIETASFAPSSTNTQPWFFLVIESDAAKQKVHEMIARGFACVREQLRDKSRILAPVFIKALDMFERYGRFDPAPIYILVFARPYDQSILSPIIDLSGHSGVREIANESTKTSVSMAMQNLLLAAHAEGLGTRVKDGVKFFLTDEALKHEFFREFCISEEYELISGIQLGYPTEHALKRQAAKRRSLDMIRKYF